MPVPDPIAGVRDLALTIMLAGARLNALDSDTMRDRVGRLVVFPLVAPSGNWSADDARHRPTWREMWEGIRVNGLHIVLYLPKAYHAACAPKLTRPGSW
jgi:hypothetical protein